MTEKNNTPRVRFSGYTENWRKVELGEILNERKVLQKISEDAPILAFAAGQGVIDRRERRSNNRDHLTRDQENKIYKLTEPNDIVYNPSNLKYGAIDRNKHGRGVISPIYVTFTTKEEPSFIELIVKGEKFKLRALQYEEGTVVKRQSVKPENLLSLSINITPSLDEQKSIGCFFQNLDQLLTLHQRQYDKLTTLKKAMLEKMFPKDGADVPEIRFRGFEGKWEEKSLGTLATFSKGHGYSKSDLIGEGTPILLYGRLYTNYQTVVTEIDTYVIDKKGSIYSTGIEVVVPASGETAEDIARAAFVAKSGVILGSDLNIVYPKNELDSSFLALNISYGNSNNELIKRAQGKSVVHLRISDLEEVKILYPSQREQQKIAIYFQNLDRLIAQHQTQITKLKNIKKACLEKMIA